MRQGFGQPWFKDRVTPGDYFSASKTVLVTDVGQHRLPTVQTLDLRVGKSIKLQRSSLNIDLDLFISGFRTRNPETWNPEPGPRKSRRGDPISAGSA